MDGWEGCGLVYLKYSWVVRPLISCRERCCASSEEKILPGTGTGAQFSSGLILDDGHPARRSGYKVAKYTSTLYTTVPRGGYQSGGNLDLFFFPLARGQQTVTRDQGGREVERNQTRVERRADVRMWTGGPRSGYASCESMLDGGGGDEQGEAQLMKLNSKSARRKAEDERMKMTPVSRQ